MSIASKLEKLTTDITNAYTSIENKGGTIPSDKNTENLSTAIDSIEVIEEATAEGEDLTLTNTKAMPIKDIQINGKTEQKTTKGKNFFDINGEKTSGVYCYKYTYNLKPNTQYTVSTNSPKGSNANVYVNSQSSANGAYINHPVTTISDSDGLFYIEVRFKQSADDTIDLYHAILDGTYYIQIEEGSTATEYEEYTGGQASPNQDYPQEIKNVEGKNKFDIGKSNNDYLTITDFIPPERYKINIDNNILSLNVFSTGQTVIYRNQHLKGNKTYSLSAISSILGGRFYIRLRNEQDTDYLTDSDVTIPGWEYNSYYKGWFEIFSNTVNMQVTVTIPNCLYWNLGLGFNSITEYIGTEQTISNIQLEEGSSVSSYLPYNSIEFKVKNSDGTKEQTEIFTFEEGQYLAEGGYLADDGIHNIRGKMDLSTLNFIPVNNNEASRTQGLFGLEYNVPNMFKYNYGVIPSILSNKYIAKRALEYLAPGRNPNDKTIATYNGTIYIQDSNFSGYTNEQVKNALQGTILQYPLIQESITPYTPTQQAQWNAFFKTKTYDDITYITTDGDLAPIVKVDYYKKI